jgi:hypothetical protein
VETAGAPATVRVTVRFPVVSTLATARVAAWKEFPLGAGGFLLASSLVHAVIGDRRNEIVGDLENVEVDFEVTGGEGEILIFLSSVDNGTGDSIIRTD